MPNQSLHSCRHDQADLLKLKVNCSVSAGHPSLDARGTKAYIALNDIEASNKLTHRKTTAPLSLGFRLPCDRLRCGNIHT